MGVQSRSIISTTAGPMPVTVGITSVFIPESSSISKYSILLWYVAFQMGTGSGISQADATVVSATGTGEGGGNTETVEITLDSTDMTGFLLTAEEAVVR